MIKYSLIQEISLCWEADTEFTIRLKRYSRRVSPLILVVSRKAIYSIRFLKIRSLAGFTLDIQG